jgi:hypothetical protein
VLQRSAATDPDADIMSAIVLGARWPPVDDRRAGVHLRLVMIGGF